MQRLPRGCCINTFYCREADDATREFEHTEQQIARYQQIATKSFAEYQNDWIAGCIATVEKQRLYGYFDTFQVVGWCGRPDLATKLAAGARAKPWHVDVTILPVTTHA